MVDEVDFVLLHQRRRQSDGHVLRSAHGARERFVVDANTHPGSASLSLSLLWSIHERGVRLRDALAGSPLRRDKPSVLACPAEAHLAILAGRAKAGGGRGIRTPATVSRRAVFKTACFNHSHIPPTHLLLNAYCLMLIGWANANGLLGYWLLALAIGYWLWLLAIEASAFREQTSPSDHIRADVRSQGLGDHHRAVALLAILENGYQRPANSQAGPIQRMRKLG